MPIISCDDNVFQFESIDTSSDGCSCSAKISRLAFARRDWLNLESMGIDENDCNTSIVMDSNAFFEVSGWDSDFVTFTQSFDEANCRYENNLTVDYQTLSKQLRLMNCNMQNFCDWVTWILTTDCNMYIIGLENIGGVMGSSFRGRVTGHEISLGGTNQLSNAVTYNWRSNCEVMQTLVTYEELPLV